MQSAQDGAVSLHKSLSVQCRVVDSIENWLQVKWSKVFQFVGLFTTTRVLKLQCMRLTIQLSYKISVHRTAQLCAHANFMIQTGNCFNWVHDNWPRTNWPRTKWRRLAEKSGHKHILLSPEPSCPNPHFVTKSVIKSLWWNRLSRSVDLARF